ncbi:hypothetical protein U5801_23560 [Lamprobacter modestohalophilus]|nr:hypothetical protein [Lamprobacter modestohalophilus]MEA1052763.1 hypothetical protein [Lamprobacter modestohalophilus]
MQGRGRCLVAHHLAVLHEQMGRVEQAREYQQLARALREGQGQR